MINLNPNLSTIIKQFKKVTKALGEFLCVTSKRGAKATLITP